MKTDDGIRSILRVAVAGLLGICLAIGVASVAHAASATYFAGGSTSGSLKMSSTVTVTGGRTDTATGGWTAVNATYVAGYLTNQSVGTGSAWLTHSPRAGARNGCYWTNTPFVSGSENIICQVYFP